MQLYVCCQQLAQCHCLTTSVDLVPHRRVGLGKTVEVLSLILANPAPASIVPGQVLSSGRIATRATLVVCAVSLVGQWMEEARSKLTGGIRIHMYHGQVSKRRSRQDQPHCKTCCAFKTVDWIYTGDAAAW